MGKVIHWEQCKRLKFDHADKWCMYIHTHTHPHSLMVTVVENGYGKQRSKPGQGCLHFT